MITVTRLAIATACSLLLAAGTAHAASDYLLEIPGVDGEASARSGSSSIELQSFSWGMSQSTARSSTGGAGAGKVNIQDSSVAAVAPTRDASSGQATGKRTHKPVTMATPDASSTGAAAAGGAVQAPAVGSPATAQIVVGPGDSPTAARLAQACATGKHFDKVVLTARGQRYEMRDVVVTCPAASASRAVAGSGRAHELKGHVTLIR